MEVFSFVIWITVLVGQIIYLISQLKVKIEIKEDFYVTKNRESFV